MRAVASLGRVCLWALLAVLSDCFRAIPHTRVSTVSSRRLETESSTRLALDLSHISSDLHNILIPHTTEMPNSKDLGKHIGALESSISSSSSNHAVLQHASEGVIVDAHAIADASAAVSAISGSSELASAMSHATELRQGSDMIYSHIAGDLMHGALDSVRHAREHLWSSDTNVFATMLHLGSHLVVDTYQSFSGNAYFKFINHLAIPLLLAMTVFYRQTFLPDESTESTEVDLSKLDLRQLRDMNKTEVHQVTTAVAELGRRNRMFRDPLEEFNNEDKLESKFKFTANTGITLADVAGYAKVKESLENVVSYFQDVERFKALGVKLPKGLLLYGPPGTGKTMFARAVAGQAGVPYISVAGSEFIQTYVGVGAARVRELYKKARENSPCIVFIDEIDAIGGNRDRASADSESTSTLNQLLVELDGVNELRDVLTIVATNTPEILDPALVRDGRFDERLEIPLPEYQDRLEILKVHARSLKLSPDVSFDDLARRTPGLPGSSLKNIMKDALLHADRDLREVIDSSDMDWAVDRALVGAQGTTADTLLAELEMVAFHEAGHAIVGGLIPEFDTVSKISVAPRESGAGGVTFFSPTDDAVEEMMSRQYLEAKLAVAWGGRVAEEIVYGPNRVSTGASSDLRSISRLSSAMVIHYGMSNLPPMSYDFENILGFGERAMSPWLREKINSEIFRLVSNSYTLAKQILLDNVDLLFALARRLTREESLTQEQFHFMLYEYNAKTVPFGIFGKSQADRMPFQLADDMSFLAEYLPKLSTALPSPKDMVDPASKEKLLALKKEYQISEDGLLDRALLPGPMLDPSWGQSRNEVMEEAQEVLAESRRRGKLRKLGVQSNKESKLRVKLIKATEQRKKLVNEFLTELKR